MTSKYVYLIYDYGEHGPTNQVGTLDFNKLPDLLKAHIETCKKHYASRNKNYDNLYDEYFESYSEKLTKFMADHSNQEFGDGIREEFSDIWGSAILEIVRLM